MTWVKIDDQFPDHRKVVEVGPLAAWLHVCALCYCSRQLTDGVFPKNLVPRLADVPAPRKLATKLVDTGLWVDHGDTYEIHEYLDWQRSRAEIEADRGVARRRGALNRDQSLGQQLKKRDANRCRYCGRSVNWRDRKSPTGGTYDHVIPIHAGGDDDFENLVVCCKECNTRKGSRTPNQAGITLEPIPDPAQTWPESSQHPDTELEVDTETDIPPYPPRSGGSPRANGTNPRARTERRRQEHLAQPQVVHLADGSELIAHADGRQEMA